MKLPRIENAVVDPKKIRDYLLSASHLVRGILKGPSGRSAEIVTVWIILSGEVVPRFVTAFPGGDR